MPKSHNSVIGIFFDLSNSIYYFNIVTLKKNKIQWITEKSSENTQPNMQESAV